MNSKRDRSNIDHGTIEISNDWLRGFVDAEGSFYASVTPNKTSALGYRVVATFAISQTASEKPVLEAIQSFLGCGFITKDSGDREVWYYRCDNIEELENKIVPFFTQNNLVLSKRLDFESMTEALKMIRAKEHLTHEGLAKIKE